MLTAQKGTLMPTCEQTLDLPGGSITLRHILGQDGNGLSLELPNGGGGMDAEHVPAFLQALRTHQDGQFNAGAPEVIVAVALKNDGLLVWEIDEWRGPVPLTSADRLLIAQTVEQVMAAVPDDLRDL